MYQDRLAEAAAFACGTFRIWGGDGERDSGEGENSDDSDKENKDKEGSAESGDSGGSGKEDDGGDSGGESDKDDEVSLQEQLDQVKRDNLTLKKSNDQLKAVKKKADADKDAAKERDEAIAERDQLKQLMDGKFLAWSIQTFDTGKVKYDWIDIDDVVKAVDPEAIDIDLETGEVKGLDLELKRIAKKKPHWLKKDDEDQEEDSGGGASGGHPRGGGAGVRFDKAEEKRVGQKYRIPGFGTDQLRAL